ncbi:MAG: ribonuclease H-like domain-containing protein [Chloroflexi bacterium]|nr:ribonuclease H-like domain-containing protein [Chloroflexota bacterium]
MFEAYLDIETTGLAISGDSITVIGIYLVGDRSTRLVQMVGDEGTRENLCQALAGAQTVFTYNGSRFDLPFIQTALGIDISRHWHHHDLMFDCWQNNLYGGFKVVEARLGIPRQLKGLSGLDAVMLWWRYKMNDDRNALELLLQYNKEDVVNLKALKEKLLRQPSRETP